MASRLLNLSKIIRSKLFSFVSNNSSIGKGISDNSSSGTKLYLSGVLKIVKCTISIFASDFKSSRQARVPSFGTPVTNKTLRRSNSPLIFKLMALFALETSFIEDLTSNAKLFSPRFLIGKFKVISLLGSIVCVSIMPISL